MSSRISRVVITPVAFGDPPLLNVVGVHQPWALRAIVELHTDSGLLGLGETYADEAHLARLDAVAAALPGQTPTTCTACTGWSSTCSAARPAARGASFGGMLDVSSAVDTVYSPVRGRLPRPRRSRGRPPGQRPARRRRARPGAVQRLPLLQVGRSPGRCPTTSGARHWTRTVSWPRRSGWSTGGASARSSSRAVCSRPTRSARRSRRSRAAFPGLPLRLDPNGAWTPETSVGVAERLAGRRGVPRGPDPRHRGDGVRRRAGPTCRSRPTCA